MSTLSDLPFARPVPTGGRPGFPWELATIAQAARIVERERMPLIRSNLLWLEAYNRLVVARATLAASDAEAGRIALAAALRAEAEENWPAALNRAA